MRITKNDLIAIVARRNTFTLAESRRYIEDLIFVIEHNILAKNKVTLSGFGTFLVRRRASRRGRNPATGADLQLPAMETVGFVPAKGFRKRLKK